MTPFLRDITQAYVQSDSTLERDVYLKPPPEMNLPPGSVLKVMKPLYGIPESGLHWYLTYLHYHLERIGMTRSTVYPCVPYKYEDEGLVGIIVLQFDDSFGVGREDFLAMEAEAANDFKTKPRTMHGKRGSQFNVLTIKRPNDGTITLGQEEKINKLTTARTQKQFASNRSLAQYVAVNVPPDICAAVQSIAPGNDNTTAQ